MEPAALVTDLLDLPGVGLRAAKVCRNKFLQREYLRDWSPRSLLVTAANRAQAPYICEDWFPVVVKPLSMWSSIGVRVCMCIPELVSFLEIQPPNFEVLVEERVLGREFSVETLVIDGVTRFGSATQKGTNEDGSPYFVETHHSVPAANVTPAEAQMLVNTQSDITDRLGFGTGMADGEFRLTHEGAILMEIAARPPGDGVLALYHLTTGEPIEAALIAAALGQDVTYPPIRRRARQVYLEHKPGVLADVQVDVNAVVGSSGLPAPTWLASTGIWPEFQPGAADEPPAVRELLILKERGERLLKLTESSTRGVTAIFDVPADGDLDTLEAEVAGAVRITTDRVDDVSDAMSESAVSSDR